MVTNLMYPVSAIASGANYRQLGEQLNQCAECELMIVFARNSIVMFVGEWGTKATKISRMLLEILSFLLEALEPPL